MVAGAIAREAGSLEDQENEIERAPLFRALVAVAGEAIRREADLDDADLLWLARAETAADTP